MSFSNFVAGVYVTGLVAAGFVVFYFVVPFGVDSNSKIQFEAVVFHKVVPPPTPDPKPIVDPDVVLLEQIYREHHLLNGKRCSDIDPSDLKIVRSPHNMHGGFGMLLAYTIIPLHTALMTNATYVGSKPEFGKWTPLKESDVFQLSPCHSMFHKDPSRFPNQVQFEGGDSRDLHTKHPLFRHRPLLWYYRQLFRLFFASVAFDRFFEKYGSIPFVKQRMGGADWDSWSEWKTFITPAEPVKIGVHMRRGDSCFGKMNPHRPPCQNTSIYAGFAMEYVKTLESHHGDVAFILLSDNSSPDVFKEFQSFIPIKAEFYHLAIDRSLYKPPEENAFVDHFLVSEEQHLTAWVDFLMEMSFLSSVDVFVAQFHSTFANCAFMLADKQLQYASIDGALPCVRGGCPGPLDQLGDDGDLWGRLNGWNPGVASTTTGTDNALYHSLMTIDRHQGKPSGYLKDEQWTSAFDVRKMWSVCFDRGCTAPRNCASDIVRGCFY